MEKVIGKMRRKKDKEEFLQLHQSLALKDWSNLYEFFSNFFLIIGQILSQMLFETFNYFFKMLTMPTPL